MFVHIYFPHPPNKLEVRTSVFLDAVRCFRGDPGIIVERVDGKTETYAWEEGLAVYVLNNSGRTVDSFVVPVPPGDEDA